MMSVLFFLAIILFILQWLFNVEVLWSVATTAPSQLPSVLIEGYFNLFRYGFDLTPFMLVTISAFQGASPCCATSIRGGSASRARAIACQKRKSKQMRR